MVPAIGELELSPSMGKVPLRVGAVRRPANTHGGVTQVLRLDSDGVEVVVEGVG